MNPTAVKLLQAADFLGGEKQLAVPPGTGQPLLDKRMAALHHAPNPLLLRAGDTMLADRRSLSPLAAIRASGLGGNPAASQ
jgi:hypothetical protein